MSEIAVIGCGVIGLTSGIRLLEAGHSITIIADELPPHTTSNAAAAYWSPDGVLPLERGMRWSGKSLAVFRQLAVDAPEAGISIQRYHRLFADRFADPPWLHLVDDFTRVPSAELPPDTSDGYTMSVPLIDTPVYMPWLMARFTALGGVVRKQRLASLREISAEFPLIVNCSGVGARQLADDADVHPIRGQVVLIRRPDDLPSDFYSISTPGDELMTYIIPRSGDCLLGGTGNVGNWDRTPNMATADAIIARCNQFVPQVANPEILGHRVGLRPGRSTIRLEAEQLADGRTVIHNYGHAGNGHSVAWGCAGDVVDMAQAVTD